MAPIARVAWSVPSPFQFVGSGDGDADGDEQAVYSATTPRDRPCGTAVRQLDFADLSREREREKPKL